MRYFILFFFSIDGHFSAAFRMRLGFDLHCRKKIHILIIKCRKNILEVMECRNNSLRELNAGPHYISAHLDQSISVLRTKLKENKTFAQTHTHTPFYDKLHFNKRASFFPLNQKRTPNSIQSNPDEC